MEAGYFHPDRGYWQVLEKAGYEPPEGAVEIPVRPSAFHQWQNGAWVEVPPTAEELAAELEAIKDDLIARFDQPTSIDKVMLKISFLQENRIRALEGKQPITAQQFKDWVRGEID